MTAAACLLPDYITYTQDEAEAMLGSPRSLMRHDP